VTSSILNRNSVRGFRVEVSQETHELESSTVSNSYPETPTGMVSYLMRMHRRKGLKPAWPFNAYLRGAKKMLDEYGPERTTEAIRQATKVSKYPFSFKFVERMVK
jgi:hypothetical protein